MVSSRTGQHSDLSDYRVRLRYFGIRILDEASSDRRPDGPYHILRPLITTETDRIGFTQPISLTYINSGNRQARISNLGLVALKYNDTRMPTDESCDAGEPDTKIYPRFDFSSIVIKPGEITDIRDIKYAFGLLSKPLGEQGIVFPNIFRLTTNDSLLVCLQQRVVTPDSYVVSLSKALWLLRSCDGDFKSLFDQGKPIIVKKTITYFD